MYRRVTGSGDSCSPPLHSSVRENYGSFWFAVVVFQGLNKWNQVSEVLKWMSIRTVSVCQKFPHIRICIWHMFAARGAAVD